MTSPRKIDDSGRPPSSPHRPQPPRTAARPHGPVQHGPWRIVTEWAVRWPNGHVEQWSTREMARVVAVGNRGAQLVSRRVAVGEWTDEPTP